MAAVAVNGTVAGNGTVAVNGTVAAGGGTVAGLQPELLFILGSAPQNAL